MASHASGDAIHRTAIIITSNPESLERVIEKAGYEVVGVSDTAVNGERLADHLQPDVIVVEHALTGEPGWDAVPHLRMISPGSKLLLVVVEDWTPSDVSALGAFAATTREHLQQLELDGADLHEWIETETSQEFVNRRTGDERRLRQDWSAVGFEKRDRPDRRGAST